tara:strand:+ start:10255 stop:12078 length:1824 start_codon:yes stop_codon:yes gene_type:complete
MLPNYSNIPLQQFMVQWVPTNQINPQSQIIYSDIDFSFGIIEKGFEPLPEIFDHINFKVIVIGNPIYQSIIDKRGSAKFILDNEFELSKIQELNGEFLFVFFDTINQRVIIINDRFSSVPFYYLNNESGFIGSFAYNDLWNYLKEKNQLEIRHEAFYEMIHYRRIFGDKTYDKSSRYLNPASILECSKDIISEIKYWEPNFDKLKISLKKAGQMLADFLKQSVKEKTSDGKRAGLFLSGGFDTRTLLAAFDRSPVCFTATYNTTGNREYTVAKELANLKNSPHHHLQLTDNHFSNILDKAVYQVGGMHQANSIFMGYRDFIRDKADVLFHGHGLDYMFQGMYLPSSHLKISNHTFSYKSLNKVPDNVVEFFINNAPYRVKYPYINDFIKEPFKESFDSQLKKDLNKIFEFVKSKTTNKYNQLEYLSFNALSRHYSYSDHAGIHTNAEQRTISFDNNIFDLFFRLPIKYRFDRVVLRKALRILDKRFFAVSHANTNLPLGSSAYQTFFEIKKKILKAVHLMPRDKPTDTHLQRTWPTHEWLIRNEDYIFDIAKVIGPGCALEKIDFLDLEKLQIEIRKWLDNPNDYSYSKEMGDFVWSLITLEVFLRQ